MKENVYIRNLKIDNKYSLRREMYIHVWFTRDCNPYVYDTVRGSVHMHSPSFPRPRYIGEMGQEYTMIPYCHVTRLTLFKFHQTNNPSGYSPDFVYVLVP